METLSFETKECDKNQSLFCISGRNYKEINHIKETFKKYLTFLETSEITKKLSAVKI